MLVRDHVEEDLDPRLACLAHHVNELGVTEVGQMVPELVEDEPLEKRASVLVAENERIDIDVDRLAADKIVRVADAFGGEVVAPGKGLARLRLLLALKEVIGRELILLDRFGIFPVLQVIRVEPVFLRF